MRFHSALHVSNEKLAKNFLLLKKQTKSNIIFMVKANAYGHGLVPIVDYCLKENLTTTFGVASLGEALELKKNIKSDMRIFVFSDSEVNNEEYHKYYNQNLIPVIHSLEELESFFKLKNIPLVLKFNTGMNRLGIAHNQISKCIELLKKHNRKNIFHLMSHFSSSYFPMEKNKRTHEQKAHFDEIIKEFKAAAIKIEETSLANSGAIEQNYSLDYSHIRPGLMLYGPKSFTDSAWNGEIISNLKANILSTFEVKRGTPLGYGGHVCDKEGLIAIVALGYGDGFLTYYSGLEISHLGFKAKIMGRVNMDLIQVYFPPQAIGKVKHDQQITIWDHSQERMQSICSQVKTIPYQFFCALSERLPRLYS